jgi:cob(I)alamin adenosyltransferase
MFKIYTKKGDSGFSFLPKKNKKIPKSDLIFEVLGTFDELEVSLGFLHSARLGDIRKVAIEVQNDLINLGTILSDGKKVTDEKIAFWEKRINELEEVVDYFESKNDPIENFILPGGCRESGFLHIGRVTCRKLERLTVSYLKGDKEKFFVIKYLNRLSDLLFVMARYSNKKLGFKDIIWKNKEL